MKCQEKVKGLCYKCRRIANPIKHTDESKKKLSLAAIKRFSNMSEEEKLKWKEMGSYYGKLQPKLTNEQRLAISGKNAHFYGMKHTNETKEKMSKIHKGKIISLEQRMRISKTCKDRKINVGDSNGMKRLENRRKVRLTTIKNLIEKYGGITPSFNLKSIEYFDKLNTENQWNLQHAKNGGEVYLKEIGFWLDAYDKDKNVVVEYDEKKHYTVSGELKVKDINRMNEIVNHLKCSFYRFNEKSNSLVKYF